MGLERASLSGQALIRSPWRVHLPGAFAFWRHAYGDFAMRSDMFKVIVERPRKGSRVRWSSGDRRFLNSEDAPPKLGIRRGHFAQQVAAARFARAASIRS